MSTFGEKSNTILDANIDTKVPLVSIDERFMNWLKPHQIDGIQFMFDTCFGFIAQMNVSGCILAHCMGLGNHCTLLKFQSNISL